MDPLIQKKAINKKSQIYLTLFQRGANFGLNCRKSHIYLAKWVNNVVIWVGIIAIDISNSYNA